MMIYSKKSNTEIIEALGETPKGDWTENIEVVLQGVPIPKGFEYSEGTKSSGLVIKDDIGNEFVWIPCTLDGAGGSVKYEKWCTTNILYSDTIDDMLPSGIANETSQILTYGGFYVARYEAGLPTGINQTTADATTRNVSGVPLSQKNVVPWNYIDHGTAKANAELMYSNGYMQSGLITGTQYDTMMKWLENTGYNVESDSGAWGNYYNVTITGITEISSDYGATWTGATTKPGNSIQVLKTRT